MKPNLIARHIILSAFITLGLAACNAPPSVQKVIDEAQKSEEAAKPRLTNPVLSIAQQEGRELYDLFIQGKWAPEGLCKSERAVWTYNENTFSRPKVLSTLPKPCDLILIEALPNGSYAIAGYCPRLELEDETVVIPATRIGSQKIIIPGVGGGTLIKCD